MYQAEIERGYANDLEVRDSHESAQGNNKYSYFEIFADANLIVAVLAIILTLFTPIKVTKKIFYSD